MPRDQHTHPIDSIDAHNRWLRLRDTAQLAADLLASAERCGADRDTLFDLVAGALDGLANLAADNERESDERGVLGDWLSYGNATAALDLWEAWLQAHRRVKPTLSVSLTPAGVRVAAG